MKRAARLLAVALCAAAGGCPGSAPPPPAATAVICGAIVTGSLPAVLEATASESGLRFSIQTPYGNYPALVFHAALPGASLQAVTYDATNGTGASTMVVEAPTGGISWTQVSAQGGSVGSFSLVIVDAGAALAVDGGTSWPSPQGSLNATLVPVGTLTDAGVGVAVSFGVTGLTCSAGP